MQVDILPGKKAVQLAVIRTPGSGFHHQIGGLLARRSVCGQLAENRLVPAQRGIADEELDKERFLFTGFRILRREGVPPPVIAVMGQRTMEHTCVPVDVMMIEHVSIPAFYE